MDDTETKTRTAAEADALIARRLDKIVRIAREDEANLMQILKTRQLERRAKTIPSREVMSD